MHRPRQLKFPPSAALGADVNFLPRQYFVPYPKNMREKVYGKCFLSFTTPRQSSRGPAALPPDADCRGIRGYSATSRHERAKFLAARRKEIFVFSPSSSSLLEDCPALRRQFRRRDHLPSSRVLPLDRVLAQLARPCDPRPLPLTGGPPALGGRLFRQRICRHLRGLGFVVVGIAVDEPSPLRPLPQRVECS